MGIVTPASREVDQRGCATDGLAPLCLNLRRNGLMTPWRSYALHEPYQITREDYSNGRVIEEPLVFYDCDRPVNTCAAFIFTTAERARDLRRTPVYVLNHAQQNSRGRSTMAALDKHQEGIAALAGSNTPNSNGFIMFSKYAS